MIRAILLPILLALLGGPALAEERDASRPPRGGRGPAGLCLAGREGASPPGAQETPAETRWRARMEAFREENAHLDPARRNAVFVGDSITEGFPLATHFPGRPVLNRGIGADTTGAVGPRGVIRRLDESVFACNPAVMVLLIGVNDLNGTATPHALIVTGVAAIVDAVRAKLPDLPIVLCTVLPTGAAWRLQGTVNPRILAFNEGVRALAAERKLPLLDLHAAYRDEGGFLPAPLTRDGIHLRPDAYVRWAALARPHVPE